MYLGLYIIYFEKPEFVIYDVKAQNALGLGAYRVKKKLKEKKKLCLLYWVT